MRHGGNLGSNPDRLVPSCATLGLKIHQFPRDCHVPTLCTGPPLSLFYGWQAQKCRTHRRHTRHCSHQCDPSREFQIDRWRAGSASEWASGQKGLITGQTLIQSPVLSHIFRDDTWDDTYLRNDHVLPKMADQVSPHHQVQLLFGQQRQGCPQQAETHVAKEGWGSLVRDPVLWGGHVPPRLEQRLVPHTPG